METLEHPSNLPLASKVADLFTRRFDPTHAAQLSAKQQEERVVMLWEDIPQNVEAEDANYLLNAMANAVVSTLRTSKYVRDRYMLALRLDPFVKGYGTVGTNAPFGVFFIYGRRC
jgi:glutamate dehydrogenase